MAEQTDRNRAFTEGDDPATFNVGPVQDFLATASREETQRIKAAEESGESRDGVLSAAEARLDGLDDEATQATAPPDAEGLAGTGNPLDMSTPYVDPAGSSVSANVGHQTGAPDDMVEAVEESERLGYIAPEQNPLKPEKPDYTQRNPEVMNQGSEG